MTSMNPKLKTAARRSAIIIGGLVILTALFYAEENWRGRRAWENCQHEWEAKGERLNWQSVVPPRVPDDQNFALTPIVYSSYGQILTRDGKAIPFEKRDTNFVNRLKMDIYFDVPAELRPTNEFGSWTKSTKTDLKIWQRFYRTAANPTNGIKTTPQPQTPAADVLLALSKYDSTVEELRAAAKLPYSRFPLDYDTDCPAAILLPQLSGIKQCGLLLTLRIFAELQNGQEEKAVDDAKLSLRLMDSLHNESFLISHLVRMAIFQITINSIYEGLAEHRWSDTQLAALDTELQKMDFLADWQTSMHGERAGNVAIVDWLRQCNKKDYSNMLGNTDGNGLWFLVKCAPAGWLEQTKVWLCNFYTNLNAVANLNTKTMQPAAARQVDLVLNRECSRVTPCNLLGKILLPAFGSAAKRFAYVQATADLARTACALERYRLAHGEYPEMLATLAPQFIAQLPHDIIGGQPLHYRRTSDGRFVLYSIGWNEKDDGGVVVFRKNSSTAVDTEKGDWVWQYPVK